jgi:hypothetical protein
MFYALRRPSGPLLVPMFLHGFWDTSVFLPRASGADALKFGVVFLPLAIVAARTVVRKNKDLRLG